MCVGPVGLIGPLSGGLVGLVVQWIWWAVGLVVGPRVWWACGSGGFCGVLTAKSPTLRGPTCQGLLGLVFFLKCGNVYYKAVGYRWISRIALPQAFSS